jgi:hypothetical protein
MPVVSLDPGTFDVTTPVGSPPVRRFRQVVALTLPTGPAGDRLELDLASTRLRATFEPFVYDALAPGPLQGTKVVQGSAVVVTLDAPRAFGVLELTASAAARRPHLQLHRVDGTVLAITPTVSAPRSGNAYGVETPFVDARVGVRGPAGGPSATITTSAIRRLWVRSDPAGVRIAITTPEAVDTAVPFWQAPDPSVTSVDETAAFADAVAAALPTGAAPLPTSVPLALVMTADAPVRLQMQELTVRYRFVDRGFAPLPLLASDVSDTEALVTMLRVPRDPVAGHLRSLLTSDLRSILDRATRPSSALVERLLAQLGAALETDELFDETRFAGVPLPLGLGTVAAGATGERRVRINRLLLEAARPEVVRPRTERRTLDLRDGASVAVRRPPDATVLAADLVTTEDLPTGRPVASDDVGAADADLGVEITADRWVAARLTLPAAVTASGVELRAIPLEPGTRVHVELREDHDGTPAGRVLATGETALRAQATTAWSRAGFGEPVVIPSGVHWVAVLASTGRAVWLSVPDGDGRWAKRARDGSDWSVLATTGRTPRVGLLGPRPSPAARPLVRLSVLGEVPASARSGDRVTYDLLPALTGTAVANASTVRIRVEATDGALSVAPPTLVYDVDM